jgi:hypothetical protein
VFTHHKASRRQGRSFRRAADVGQLEAAERCQGDAQKSVMDVCTAVCGRRKIACSCRITVALAGGGLIRCRAQQWVGARLVIFVGCSLPWIAQSRVHRDSCRCAYCKILLCRRVSSSSCCLPRRVGKNIESFGNVGRNRRIDWLGIYLPIWPLRTSSFYQHTVYFNNRIKNVLMIVSNRYSHCSHNLLTPSDRLPATALF